MIGMAIYRHLFAETNRVTPNPTLLGVYRVPLLDRSNIKASQLRLYSRTSPLVSLRLAREMKAL
jgi:hypothetical protein